MEGVDRNKTRNGGLTEKGSWMVLQLSPLIHLEDPRLHVSGGYVTSTYMRKDETEQPLLFRSRDPSLFLNAKAQDPKNW